MKLDLVPITAPEFDVDVTLAYATAANLTGRPVYRNAECWLHRAAAERFHEPQSGQNIASRRTPCAPNAPRADRETDRLRPRSSACRRRIGVVVLELELGLALHQNRSLRLDHPFGGLARRLIVSTIIDTWVSIDPWVDLVQQRRFCHETVLSEWPIGDIDGAAGVQL